MTLLQKGRQEALTEKKGKAVGKEGVVIRCPYFRLAMFLVHVGTRHTLLAACGVGKRSVQDALLCNEELLGM